MSQSWFFMAMDGTIKKKNKNRYRNAEIFEAFTKGVKSDDEVVATYLKPRSEGDPQNGIPADNTLCIEYLDRAALDGFLFHRKKDEKGILQRFVSPAGGHNSAIRCIWSPTILLTERCQNRIKINDSHHPLLDRAVTYDGAECQIETAPLRGKVLERQLNLLCESMAAHIKAVRTVTPNSIALYAHCNPNPNRRYRVGSAGTTRAFNEWY
jgi:hypothetical protein